MVGGAEERASQAAAMGEVCFKACDDELEELPVMQVNHMRPRPKQKSRSKAMESDRDVGYGTISHQTCTGVGLCSGGNPVDEDELSAPSVPAHQRRREETAFPPKPSPSLFKLGKPDFTGQWICSDVGGDIEGFMVALNFSWARRTAAQIIDYGIGRASRHIVQRGNEFVVECGGFLPTVFQQRFKVGRGPQMTDGPEGSVLVTPTWEKGYVLSVLQSELDGSEPSCWKQYFQGKDLMVQIIARTGESGIWRFTKK